MDDSDSVAIYGNRRLSLLAALACAGVGIYAGLSYFVWSKGDKGTPWGLAGPLNFAVSAAITLAFATGVAYALLRMLTPIPLLKFDSAGIHYRPVPRRGWFVAWKEVAHIWLSKSSLHIYFRTVTSLTLYVRPKAGPAARQYGTRLLRVELARRSLWDHPQDLVERISRFHHVEYRDSTGRVPSDSHA